MGLAFILFASCQQAEQRYFDESAEIDTIKQLFQSVEDGNYDEIRTFYNDTAKIYENSDKSISIDSSIAEGKRNRGDFAMYTFKDSLYPEMVITKTGQTWVNLWPTWVGKVSGGDDEITIPAHATYRFEDGKIVEEYVYYNALPIYFAFEKVKASAAEEAKDEDEGGDN